MAKKNVQIAKEQTIQSRVEEANDNFGVITFSQQRNPNIDLTPSPWWSEHREKELEIFWMLPGNDILAGSISSFIKKFKSMNWSVEGPSRIAKQNQLLLTEADFGEGWTRFLGKVIQDRTVNDKGAFVEVIATGAKDEPINSKILGIAHLDNQYCVLTGDIDHPVIFTNAKDNTAQKLHQSRVIHFVNMPSPNTLMHNVGFSPLSQVISASSLMLKLTKYKDEKITDLPETGLLLFNNVLPDKWDNKILEYESKRQQMGQHYWKNLITLFGLDPTQPATAQLISFANLPEHFDELVQTDIYINIIALALGISPKELWEKSGRSNAFSSTATEITIQHQQATNKGVGEIITEIERELNRKVMSITCQFKFDFVDDQQDMQATEINNKKIEGIMKMWKPPTNEIQNEYGIPVPAHIIRQMLADQVTWFDETFLGDDLTDKLVLTDTEKYFGARIKIDNKGRIKSSKLNIDRTTKDVIGLVEQNYRNGNISLDELIEFRLGNLIDKKLID